LQRLDEADAQEQAGPLPVSLNAAQLQHKIAKLRGKKEQVEQRLQQLQASGESQISLSDPDSRAMGKGARSCVGYNVQATVDSKHQLLVTTEVTNASNDLGQLAPQAQAAKAELGVEKADVVADTGYYKSEDIKSCQEAGLEPHVRAGQMSPSERAGLYGKADFTYDAGRDLYRCPAGAELTRRRRMEVGSKVIFNYDNPAACADCPLKSRCTAAGCRTLSRWEHEASLERMAQQVAAHPEKLGARGSLIEHCFGTMKWLLPGGFLVCGKAGVGAEVSLAHFAYNLKRAMAVVGLEKLLAGLKQRVKKTVGGVPRVRSRKQRTVAGLIELICEIAAIRSSRWNFAA
jgi:transposase